MTVDITSPVAGVTRTLSDQSVKLSAALANSRPVSDKATASAVPLVPTDPVTIPPQIQGLTLRVDSLNISFTATQVNVVDSGASQVSRLLSQLQSLATRASSGGLSASELELINGQFQALRISINNVPPAPPGAEVKVDDLLQGLGADAGSLGGGAVSTLGGFSDAKFFADAGVTDLLTQASAQRAVDRIGELQVSVEAQRATISKLQDVAEFASASVESALQNQDASRATLGDADLDGGAGGSLLAALQAQSAQAQAAQTSKLPGNVLQLLA